MVIIYFRESGDYPELVELQAEVSKLKLHLEKVNIIIRVIVITCLSLL